MKPERIISKTGPDEDVISLVLNFVEKSGPFTEKKCEDTCAAEEMNGVLEGSLTINPRIEVHVVCVNPGEHLDRIRGDELLL